MRFLSQEYGSGVPCPPPGDLPDLGIEPTSPASPALAGSLLLAPLCSCEYENFNRVSRTVQLQEELFIAEFAG